MTILQSTLAAAAALALAAPAAAPAAPSRHVPGELLVKFADRAAPLQRAAAFAARAHAPLADLEEGWTRVRVRPGESVEEAIVAYAGDDRVEYAQPNYVYWKAGLAPIDPGYAQQWALQNTGTSPTFTFQPQYGLYTPSASDPDADIDVEPAWSVTTDCSGALVAVLDTGINYTHADLAPNLWDGGTQWPHHGYDTYDGDDDPMDFDGHGTHVAGIIGAVGVGPGGTGAIGGVGVCWKARIMAVRVLNSVGYGTSASIIEGVYFALARGAKVLNMSFEGGNTLDGAYASAIAAADAAGALVVAAAGNSGLNVDQAGHATFPCAFTHPNVLCVAALDQSFGLATFSNHGATSVDVGAPGTNIYATWAGTRVAVLDEDYAAGWTYAPASGGWTSTADEVGPLLVDPPDWVTSDTSRYGRNVDHRAWKPLATSGAAGLVVETYAWIDLLHGDLLEVWCRAGGGDPFSSPDGPAEQLTAEFTHGDFLLYQFDVARCGGPAVSTVSVGFRLDSSATTAGGYGVALEPFGLWRSEAASLFNTLDGTSMAAPVVAGVAALLRSYHPAFTPDDTREAIVRSGLPVSALAGRTTSGKAVRATAALRHVRTPTGLGFRER